MFKTSGEANPGCSRFSAGFFEPRTSRVPQTSRERERGTPRPSSTILLLLALPAVLIAGPGRYARLGDFDGQVEVQLSAADAWMPAERNLPLPESAWIRTGPGSRVEIELDTGGAWRLGSESQGGLSDYSRLSTGQRVTLLMLDRGIAYFTGEAKGRDALTLVAPGAQVAISKPARVRIEAQDQLSQLAVLQGVVRFSSAAAEIDLAQGQTTRVEPGNTSRFFLYREVTPLDADRWSAARDKALTTPVAALHVAEQYGLADLDASGQQEWSLVTGSHVPERAEREHRLIDRDEQGDDLGHIGGTEFSLSDKGR